MQVTDELRVVVEAEVARAIENFKKLEGCIDGAEKKTQSFGEALDSISKKSLVISGVLGAAGVAAVKFAGENEKLKLSLKNMLGSADEAATVFEEWRRLGASPGLSTNEVFELGQSMVNMGHDTAYATKTMQMLGNVAAGTGKSFGAVSGAFEHIRAVGKLTARDLASLQQQGIPIIKQLAKDLNTSEDGIRRMVAEGKIGFPELEKAFRGMAGPGGQFAGMMDGLSGTVLEKFSTAASEAKQALASFGETMLPMATELLDGATSILRGIADMDEGTKRFVLGMGGVVAVSGPTIGAIKGISAAMKAAMANPYMLAIGGIIVAAGAVAGIVNKQAHAYADLNTQIHKTKTEADGLLRSYADGNNAKLLDAETTGELIRLYPSLSGEVNAYTTTVGEAAAAVKRLTEAEIENAAQRQIERLKEQARAAESAAVAYERYSDGALRNIETAERMGDAFSVRQFRDAIETYKHSWDEAENKAASTRRAINAELARIGKTLGDDFAIIDIPVNITIPDPESSSIGSHIAAKKRWQDWYGEITKIDPAKFGDSGAKAAELYLAEFSRSFEAGKTIFAALGEEFDIAGALKSQQADIQKTLVELFSIDPDDIDDPFKTYNGSMEPLIANYRRLGEEIKSAEDAMKAAAAEKEYAQKIEDLRKKIGDFGKSESQLAYEAALASGALAGQAEEARGLMDEYRRTETIAEYRRQIDELAMSERERAMAAFAAAGATHEELQEFERLYDQLAGLKERAFEVSDALKGIGDSLASLGANSSLTGIEELGHALGQGANAGEAMKNALAAMHMEILNALPNLFLQAGLQLISQGQWAMGLGFVAAAGSTALIKGYVGGKAEGAQSASHNAHGNIFDAAGVTPFAHGGSFTNQIVSQPTLFKFARGTGLMGEAGPEAVVPLRRMANGDLGVRSGGGGANVTVNIINNSGAEATREEREDGNGNKQIDIVIGEMVNRHLASGKADRVLGGRYGVRAAGV
jgi:lambda family phage tail tape measure protein